jgi:hypothetical protein
LIEQQSANLLAAARAIPEVEAKKSGVFSAYIVNNQTFGRTSQHNIEIVVVYTEVLGLH